MMTVHDNRYHTRFYPEGFVMRTENTTLLYRDFHVRPVLDSFGGHFVIPQCRIARQRRWNARANTTSIR